LNDLTGASKAVCHVEALGGWQDRKFSPFTILGNTGDLRRCCPVVFLELLELTAEFDAEFLADPADRHVDGAILRVAGGLDRVAVERDIDDLDRMVGPGLFVDLGSSSDHGLLGLAAVWRRLGHGPGAEPCRRVRGQEGQLKLGP
jgi:hypothetical protein